MTDRTQIELDFEGGLLDQYGSFSDVLSASVYGCGRPFKHVAADLDMTASKLSRMLANNPNDNIHPPGDRIDDIISATGDLRPVYWLIERFIEDADIKRKRALDQVSKMLPQLESLLKAASQ